MATSSITIIFLVEGKDAEDFANSLDESFREREERRKNFEPAVKIVSKEEKKQILDRYLLMYTRNNLE